MNSFTDKHPNFKTSKQLDIKVNTTEHFNYILNNARTSLELRKAIELFANKETNEALREITTLLNFFLNKHRSEKE
jgi:hypothetical protein